MQLNRYICFSYMSDYGTWKKLLFLKYYFAFTVTANIGFVIYIPCIQLGFDCWEAFYNQH